MRGVTPARTCSLISTEIWQNWNDWDLFLQDDSETISDPALLCSFTRKCCPSYSYYDWELFSNTGLTGRDTSLRWHENSILGQLASLWHSVLVSSYGRDRQSTGIGRFSSSFSSIGRFNFISCIVKALLCSVFVIWSNNSLVKTGRISGGNWSSVMPLCHLNCKNSWFYQILGEKKTHTTTKLNLIPAWLYTKWYVVYSYLFLRR